MENLPIQDDKPQGKSNELVDFSKDFVDKFVDNFMNIEKQSPQLKYECKVIDFIVIHSYIECFVLFFFVYRFYHMKNRLLGKNCLNVHSVIPTESKEERV